MSDLHWESYPENIRKWLLSDDFKPEADSLADMIAEAREWVLFGKIEVFHGNSQYFEMLECRFPIGLNRIDWSCVAPHNEFDVIPGDLVDTGVSGECHEQLLADCKDTLVKWLGAYGTKSTDVLNLIGDGGNGTFRMPLEVLLGCYVKLFSLGQHTYVFPDSMEWCLNYTLGGQLFSGRSADSLRTGVS